MLLATQLMLLTTQLKVGEIGDGVFVIMFFGAIAMLMCFFGFKSQSPGMYCCLGTLLVTFMILIFTLSPKGEVEKDNLDPDDTASQTVARTSMFIFLLVGALIGLVMLLTNFCTNHIKAYRLPGDRKATFTTASVD